MSQHFQFCSKHEIPTLTHDNAIGRAATYNTRNVEMLEFQAWRRRDIRDWHVRLQEAANNFMSSRVC